MNKAAAIFILILIGVAIHFSYLKGVRDGYAKAVKHLIAR